MRQLLLRFAMLVFLPAIFFVACQKDSPMEPSADEARLSQTYIVVLDFSTENTIQGTVSVKARINQFIASKGIAPEKVSFVYTNALIGFAAELTADEYKAIDSDKLVKYIEIDKIVSLPPFTINAKPSKPGGGTPPAQTTPWGITAVGGAASGTFTKKAWIIDTGIDLDHPDLNVNTSLSRTFVTSGPDSRNADDANGHGTHVAGTIGAKNDDYGVVGVAPGCTLVAIKVLNRNGSGTLSAVIAGVDHVAGNASTGDVANMSLGGGVSTSLDDAVYNAAAGGVLFAIAAGNESSSATNSSPARVNHVNVYTVSAHNSSFSWASFSNYGNPPIDYCAPGVSVYSTYKDKGYATLSGTSMAAPHVAGILVTGSAFATSSNGNSGYVYNDPDGTPDKLAYY